MKAQRETANLNDMFMLAEQAAHSLVTLCYHIGTNHINFDIKQGNLLRRDAKAEFFVTDFDAMYYRYVDPDIGGRKACFFVNLLLLAMHIRSYTMSHSFSDVLLRVFAPILVELWTECVRSPDTFGEGAKWLRDARLLPTQESGGSFNQKALRKLPRGAAVGRQLSMMVFEYLDNHCWPSQQIVAEWPFGKSARLLQGVPSLGAAAHEVCRLDLEPHSAGVCGPVRGEFYGFLATASRRRLVQVAACQTTRGW